MRVKFIQDYLYETEGRGKGPSFKVGQVEEFRDDIAERFIKRGVAVKADGAGAAAAAPAAKQTDQHQQQQQHGTREGSTGGKPAGEGGGKPGKL